MTPRAYLGEIYRAHYALYQYHIKCRDDDEVTADLTRAPIIRDALAKRFGLDAVDGYTWFTDAIRRCEQTRAQQKRQEPVLAMKAAP